MSNIRLLDNDDLQSMVDYSFGDQSGVLGGIPQAYMKKANLDNKEFRDFCMNREIANNYKPITLFIDNIRLYKRPLEFSDWLHLKPISIPDMQWLNHFHDENLLELLGTPPFTNLKFIIFTAFEDTPLDNYIWLDIPRNVKAIYSANGVQFGGRVYPFPHGLERKMYEGYDHQEILKEYIDKQWLMDVVDIPFSKLLFVAHREDTGDRKSIGELFKNKDWVTVSHLPYREYLKGIKNHKFVLCPSGNGIESARNWETLYMRRVPVFKDHPYLREVFKDFPALFVNDFSEVTEELLQANEHLYKQAQTMDMEKLSLDYWFNKATK